MPMAFAQIEAALAALGGEAGDSLQLIAAAQLAEQYYPQLDPGQPALLLSLSDREQARRVARTLLAAYPGDHPATLVHGGHLRGVTLSALAGEAHDDGTERAAYAGAALYVPPLAEPGAYASLQNVVARLRAPDGCPWDRALTWDKLRSSLLEETYELLAALDAADPAKIAEEQGDLLLQVALQAQIAVEEGRFRLPEVIALIVGKLIRRHPHVFGDVVVSGTEEVLANWEAIKRAERANNHEVRSPLAGVPADLPALAQADAYQDRMSRLQASEVPAEPWAGLAALAPGAPATPETVGQALFELVAWARARGVDAESALRATNARYAAAVARAQGDKA